MEYLPTTKALTNYINPIYWYIKHFGAFNILFPVYYKLPLLVLPYYKLYLFYLNLVKHAIYVFTVFLHFYYN